MSNTIPVEPERSHGVFDALAFWDANPAPPRAVVSKVPWKIANSPSKSLAISRWDYLLDDSK
jgi:hypothetical protein